MDKNDKLANHLERLGAAARQDARKREDSFMREFQARLATEKVRRSPLADFLSRPVISWKMFGGAMVAGAATLALVLVLRPTDTPIGTLAFESGGVLIAGSGAESGLLSRGAILETTPTGNTLASLDGGRVMVYMAGGARMALENRTIVSLETGSAWFAVTPNSGRFTVELPDSTITVTGTAFGVQLTDRGSTVFLANGSIFLLAGGESHLLQPDQSAQTSFGGTTLISTHMSNSTPEWVSRLYSGFQFAYNSAYFPSSLPSTKPNQNADTP